MSSKNIALQLNVGFIVQQSIGYSRDFDFEIPHADLVPDLHYYDLSGTLKISRTSEGLLAQGTFNASIHTTCGRCLENSTSLLKSEFTELFVFPSHATHSSAELELILPEDGLIDFNPIVGEYLSLEVPINPVCKQDCRGLCLVCGNNLNFAPCDHESDEIDPRFAVLRDLLDDK